MSNAASFDRPLAFGRQRQLSLWERKTQGPLLVAALLFLVSYAIRVIWPGQNIIPAYSDNYLLWVTWIAFGVDYVVRFVIAPDRWLFFRHNLIDLISIALPVARPLRALRALAALTALNRIGANTLRGRLLIYTVGATALILFVAALAITDAERGQPGSSIENFGDGLWWSVITMAMVGYGDLTPVTLVGRLIAVCLITCGVILFGVVAATLSSWVIARLSTQSETDAAMLHHLDELQAEVNLLRAEISEHKNNAA